MALRLWLESLKHGVTGVTSVQAPVYAGSGCNPTENTGVTRVTEKGERGDCVTHVTPPIFQGLQRKPAWIKAVTPVTPVTPEKVNTGIQCKKAATGREVEIFTERQARFTGIGLATNDASALADKLVKRDRESDDRRLCLECLHLTGKSRSWQCGNWQQAGVAIQAKDARLPDDFVRLLQRCAGFAGVVN